ncbi:MAG: hypothetical protein HY077_06155 [Elusimicrobia bacterium]|nr:hypothetical protein [Elusimicrobiota bacterium]
MPDVADFSREATKKAVLKATLEHPVTMYSAGVGMLGALAVGLFGAATLPVAATVGGLGLGMGSMLYNYFVRGDALADLHVKQLYEDLAKQRRKTMDGLEKSLKRVGDKAKGEVAEQAEQGAQQFSQIGERFETLKKTLDEKLSTGELTYGRYLGAAEQVYLSVLDNLSVMAAQLQSVAAIDTRYISSKRKALGAQNSQRAADKEELKTLEERDRLVKETLEKVNDLVSRNEVAITQMDKLSAALAELRTLPGASVDLDTAIGEMEELAKQASQYNREQGGA